MSPSDEFIRAHRAGNRWGMEHATERARIALRRSHALRGLAPDSDDVAYGNPDMTSRVVLRILGLEDDDIRNDDPSTD